MNGTVVKIPQIEPNNSTAHVDCIIPISVTSRFDNFFEGKYVSITGIDQYFVQDIHYWLHNYGSLYEYQDGCEVVIVVGKYAPQNRLKRLQRKYPHAIFIEFNRELSEFVNCKYESAITITKRKRNQAFTAVDEKQNNEKSSKDSIVIKVIAGIIATVVIIAMVYFGLGLFILLMIFLPGAAKAFLKGLIK